MSAGGRSVLRAVFVLYDGFNTSPQTIKFQKYQAFLVVMPKKENFYQPKGEVKRSPWGQLDSPSISYVVGEVRLGFPKYDSKNFCICGWAGGDQMGPSICLIFYNFFRDIRNSLSSLVSVFF